MKTKDLGFGDEAFGFVCRHPFKWFIVRFRVVKETKHNIWVAWNKETEKNPQMMKKNNKETTMRKTRAEAWKAFSKQAPDYLIPKKYKD